MEEDIEMFNHQVAPRAFKKKNKKDVIPKAKENNTKTISLKTKKAIKF